VPARPNLDNLFSIAYENTLAKQFSLNPSNSFQFHHRRHKTLHLPEPPSTALVLKGIETKSSARANILPPFQAQKVRMDQSAPSAPKCDIVLTIDKGWTGQGANHKTRTYSAPGTFG
jgi:hypothetical protein